MNLALVVVFPTVGPTELIVLLTIILLLFGARKIPELARGLGTGVREFKRGTSGETEKDAVQEDREGDGELPRGEAAQNEKVRAKDENVRAGQAGQQP